jgi:anti-sigma factor ChrR (cupin superfamily)
MSTKVTPWRWAAQMQRRLHLEARRVLEGPIPCLAVPGALKLVSCLSLPGHTHAKTELWQILSQLFSCDHFISSLRPDIQGMV